MHKFVSGLAAVLLAGGCSWQDTLHTAGEAPGYLRLDERIWVEHAPRWRLPAAARVSVVDDGEVPEQWISAAAAGVAVIFQAGALHAGMSPTGVAQNNREPAQYRLQVQWPQIPAPIEENATTSTSYKAGWFGFLEVPDIPPAQTLTISVIDGHGQFVTSVNLHISPELWGPTWQDMSRLQNSFTQLATSLRGG